MQLLDADGFQGLRLVGQWFGNQMIRRCNALYHERVADSAAHNSNYIHVLELHPQQRNSQLIHRIGIDIQFKITPTEFSCLTDVNQVPLIGINELITSIAK